MKRTSNRVIFITILLIVIITAASGAVVYRNAISAKQQAVAIKNNMPLPEKKDTLPIQLNIPEGYGHIVEGYKAEDSVHGVIVHIQDIHTNYEAQKNAAQMLEIMIKENGLKLIMVEGGWGNVNLTYLRAQADKERRLEVAEEYLKEGKIAGEEYLDIISDYDMDIEGVEEEALYRKNLDAFFKIESFRIQGTEMAASLIEIINALKQKLYNPTLIELEKKHLEYDEEEISLAEFYDYLVILAKQQRISMDGLVNFSTFIRLAKLEGEIDFPLVEKQRTQLIEKISKKLDKEKLTGLVSRSLEFKLNKIDTVEFHAYLESLAKETGNSLKNYRELSRYIDYINSHEKINTNMLFKEADTLESRVKETLVQDKEQQSLMTLSKVLGILNSFLNLKLVPDDFKFYKENKQSFLLSGWLPFLQEELQKNHLKLTLPDNVSILDDNLLSLVEFYELAYQRDLIFVDKAILLMDKDKQKISVLITGGFHTPNLTELLRERDISYIVIAPKTTEKTDPELYRYILQYKSGRAE
ncbi:MAG: hypothetical protein JW946_04225 [Candidatus Omnitrophica bacterium]|nr:hypothetical protein [Candidatus Omnitrophota bacterium]